MSASHRLQPIRAGRERRASRPHLMRGNHRICGTEPRTSLRPAGSGAANSTTSGAGLVAVRLPIAGLVRVFLIATLRNGPPGPRREKDEMNAPERMVFPDMQSQFDSRNIHIDAVGVSMAEKQAAREERHKAAARFHGSLRTHRPRLSHRVI